MAIDFHAQNFLHDIFVRPLQPVSTNFSITGTTFKLPQLRVIAFHSTLLLSKIMISSIILLYGTEY